MQANGLLRLVDRYVKRECGDNLVKSMARWLEFDERFCSRGFRPTEVVSGKKRQDDVKTILVRT